MIKELVKKRFAKSLKTYSENAVIQKEMAKKLVSFIDEKNFNNVLELGCGTGFLTKELTTKTNISEYFAIDMVQDCEKYICDISDKIKFICGDIEENQSVYEKKYDLIISNAVLQWIDNLPFFISKLSNNLTNDGYLVFTIFGKENYKELIPFIKNPIQYYNIDEIRKMCTKYEIVNLFEDKISMSFETPVEVLRHIKNTGVNALSETRWTKSDLLNFEKEYPKSKNITLTYNPIYVVLKKPME